MADSFLTLTDLAKINDQNAVDYGVTDLLQDAPFLAALAADIASGGDTHKYLKEIGAPVVGFRAINDGRENSKSEDTAVTITLKVLDASFTVDVALADAYKGGREAYIARELRRHIRAAYAGAEQQVIYGATSKGLSTDGFTGLTDNAQFNALADSMVYNAGGTTADTASSVWLIRTNDLGTDVQVITGKNGNIAVGDTVVQRVAGTTGTYPAYYTPVTGWMGMQIGGAYSAVRIANLTADTGKGLTDAIIYEALAKFPASRQPNLIVMNRRSQKQLRASRTATNVTGAPAPRPTEVEGIPIIVTDSIVSTEALVA